MHVRVCPECDCEYQPRVERCSDCGVPLVDRLESDEEEPVAGGEPGHAPAEALPPGEYLPLLHRDTAAELDELAARLGERQLPYRVQVHRGYSFELRVRREEHEQALRALEGLLRPEDFAEALPPGFDPEQGAYAQCPACQAALPGGASECPECGLQLAPELSQCAACGGELDAAAGRCLRCEPEPG